MIKLEKDAVLNDYVQPACLPSIENYRPATNVTAWIVGFGVTSESGRYTTYLRNANVTYYVDSNACSQYGSRFDSETEICAGEKSSLFKIKINV